MAITSANHNAIPVVYFASGSFIDTGTVKKTILNLGFKPRYFKLLNETDSIQFEVYDGDTGGRATQRIADGTASLLTTTGPELVRDLDSGTVSTWTVYETAKGVVGTTSVGLPLTDASEAADNSRLNAAGEKFTGVTIPAALVITSKQFRWIAWA